MDLITPQNVGLLKKMLYFNAKVGYNNCIDG
jgi:hypothetical protein